MDYRAFGDTLVLRLDPGEEICQSILDLAENLIRLSGLEPNKDIEIIETGLRPGEKLYEELLEDRPYLHLHMSCGDSEGRVFGGHLNRAIISATAEIVIRRIPGEVGRRHDERIGLNLFAF